MQLGKLQHDYTGRGNESHWEARHPLEARHDPCSRWRYLFSKYLTPSASYSHQYNQKKENNRENQSVRLRPAFLSLLG